MVYWGWEKEHLNSHCPNPSLAAVKGQQSSLALWLLATLNLQCMRLSKLCCHMLFPLPENPFSPFYFSWIILCCFVWLPTAKGPLVTFSPPQLYAFTALQIHLYHYWLMSLLHSTMIVPNSEIVHFFSIPYYIHNVTKNAGTHSRRLIIPWSMNK